MSVVVLSLAGAVRWDHLRIAGALALPTWLGFAVSSRFIRYLDERLLRRGVFVVSSVASVVLLTRGILG
ncbi:MAG: hypothetical protein GEU79_18430 [Acidimicrobiia bacterium]|nr:hypothetical protein [Acidimicrobiia bacterium]